MVPIGYRPIIWHLMKYYAHYGHTDFILCLGYQAQIIKSYFLEYQETLSNDFILEEFAGYESIALTLETDLPWGDVPALLLPALVIAVVGIATASGVAQYYVCHACGAQWERDVARSEPDAVWKHPDKPVL